MVSNYYRTGGVSFYAWKSDRPSTHPIPCPVPPLNGYFASIHGAIEDGRQLRNSKEETFPTQSDTPPPFGQ
jgi:hypothetical protein